MLGIAVKALDLAGGQQLNGGQDFCFIGDQPVVLLGDPVEPHGPGLHAAAVMLEASEFIFIDEIPICLEGHLASCGHPTTGRDWAFASE